MNNDQNKPVAAPSVSRETSAGGCKYPDCGKPENHGYHIVNEGLPINVHNHAFEAAPPSGEGGERTRAAQLAKLICNWAKDNPLDAIGEEHLARFLEGWITPAVAAQGQKDQTGPMELCWLIEIDGKYWTVDEYGICKWSADAWSAVRFCRKADAEKVKLSATGSAISQCVQHSFEPSGDCLQPNAQRIEDVWLKYANTGWSGDAVAVGREEFGLAVNELRVGGSPARSVEADKLIKNYAARITNLVGILGKDKTPKELDATGRKLLFDFAVEIAALPGSLPTIPHQDKVEAVLRRSLQPPQVAKLSDPLCKRCNQPRSDHGIEPPYDLVYGDDEYCESYSYIAVPEPPPPAKEKA